MDGTRVCDMGEVVVESEARWRAGGGPIEPSIVRVGLTVVGVGSLLVVLVGDVAVAFIRTLLPSVVTRVVVDRRRGSLGGFACFRCIFVIVGETGRRT
jgi:hypothetical protein